ncbi:ABC transporter permease [Aureimonas fodinaquatilis]|uniref:ABC transporter permease n=1 Tax=Aureimonas fodinaquatilis TaxID=2565783 RepID=A0A5B0DT54_9HYPH|nr:ABC transporter permease [Aureimonas fodinaquatilis]KAA0969588.1 ABC transporter permease [Aureimonas fodinaquatilis]
MSGINPADRKGFLLFDAAQKVSRLLPLVILAAVWELLGATGLISRQMLPSLGLIFSEFVTMLFNGDLLYNTYRSLSRAGSGLVCAIVVGVLAGLLMANFRTTRLLLNPIIQIFYPMPKSALIPVVMIWLGLGDSSKILLIFLGCLLPVVVGTYNGARGVNPFLIWSARSLGASQFQVLYEITLPAAMPEILNGCRTALAFSFILMVSSEFLIATDGVGYMISSLGDGGIYPAMFAVILFVAAIGFVADRIYTMFVKRQLRWRDA